MYILCILIIVFMWEIYKAKGLTEKRRNTLIVISGLLLFLFAALRHEYVGRDVPLYFNKYEQHLNTTFETALSWFSDGSKDPGYYFSSWLCGQIFENPQWLLIFIAAFYMSTVVKVIKRYSVEPCMSFVAFMMLGFFSFSLTGLRQTVAMGITLLAFVYCTERKIIKFALLVILASYFHKSALVFFIVYPIYNLKFSKWHIVAIILSIVAFVFFKEQVRELMFKFVNDSSFDNYVNYEDSEKAYTLTNFYIQGCMLVFTGFYYKKVIAKFKSAVWFYNMSIIGVVTQLFASMLAEIFRLSMYFSIANIFLIPMAIHTEEDVNIRQIEYLLVLGVLVLYIILRGNIPYAFFWEKL